MIRLSRWLVLVSALTAPACHSAPPKYLPYYQGWETSSANVMSSLDASRRRALSNPNDPDLLLRYARVSSRFAREQADAWLASTGGPDVGSWPSATVTRARLRLQESGRQTLALYHEYRLKGGILPWQDRVEMAWLLILDGFDADAHDILSSVIADPEVSERTRNALRRVSGSLLTLPPVVRP